MMLPMHKRYNQGIKLGIQDTERLIKDFAKTTLEDLKLSRKLLKSNYLNKYRQLKVFSHLSQIQKMVIRRNKQRRRFGHI